MGKLKNHFHDEIVWNGLDEGDKAEALNLLTASRRADREKLAEVLTGMALRHGASVERRDRPANRICGQSIRLSFECNNVGAMVGIDDVHGGAWALVHWYNDGSPVRNFTTAFNLAVKSGGNSWPHHKVTSHPRDWYSLAKLLDAGLLLAARGEAFQEPSAT